MDFVHDQLATGTKTAGADDRRYLALLRQPWSRVLPSAARMSSKCWKGSGERSGLPVSIRVDQGTEFVSRDLDLWAYQRGVTLDFSRPGKPTDNAFIEAFNRCFRRTA